MNKWEYFCLVFKPDDTKTINVDWEVVNKYGAAGWELVQYIALEAGSQVVIIFKRPTPDPQ